MKPICLWKIREMGDCGRYCKWIVVVEGLGSSLGVEEVHWLDFAGFFFFFWWTKRRVLHVFINPSLLKPWDTWRGTTHKSWGYHYSNSLSLASRLPPLRSDHKTTTHLIPYSIGYVRLLDMMVGSDTKCYKPIGRTYPWKPTCKWRVSKSL